MTQHFPVAIHPNPSQDHVRTAVLNPNQQQDHTHTVVFLHGRFDKAFNFADRFASSRSSENLTLMQHFPSIRWVFPSSRVRHAVTRPNKTPISQWFDILDMANLLEREDMQASGLRDSVAMIRQILADEAALLGGRWDRVFLMGVSQGAATSVHTLLNLNIDILPGGLNVQGQRRLAGFIGFSCRMPFPGRSLVDTRKILGLHGTPEGNEILRTTPIMLEHCSDDALIQVAKGRELMTTLQKFGAEVEWKEYEQGGHWFNSPHGIDDAIEFIRARMLESLCTDKP